MTRLAIAIASALLAGACAAAPEARPAAVAATASPLTRAVRVPVPPVAELLASTRLSAPAQVRIAAPKPLPRSRGGTPIQRVDAANRAALREPVRDGYLDAVQIYAWSPGALYRLYTAPEQVSDIALEPGEALVSVAAGDTARWIIGDTTSGSGASQRTHILIKPSAAGLATNLVIATDRRMYHVEVQSSARAAMASISWTYPGDTMLVLKGESVPPAENDIPVPASAALDFGYAIEGDHPAWRPIRAFDDGRQVFIEFPASLAQGEAPPLLVSAPNGATALVNYRVRGRFYVVDRLFSAAELRLGEAHQQVVRIVRVGQPRKGRAGKSS